MKFDNELRSARLVRRYKRFLADVVCDDGEALTVHCANPGRMLGLLRPGGRVLLSHSDNPKRKLPWSWELARVGRHWVCVNTLRANGVVSEGLKSGRVPALNGFDELLTEVPYGTNRRVDFVLRRGSAETFLEVKAVTLAEGRRARFPDSVTRRGTEHLKELARVVRGGQRAILFFLVHRSDCDSVEVAEELDPTYAEEFRRARAAGVEVMAYRAQVGRRGTSLADPVPLVPAAAVTRSE